ncbi:MAG: MBL fold metallo-hydrolase [Muribaculaceae bacterium]|nr:MBL fold metallo-hydrolase [Muribaculaceae bacterium]
MKVARFTFNPFYENCYVLWQAEGGDAYVVDPGMMNDQEQNALVAFLDEKKLSVSAILLTHMHIDHVAGARWLAQKYSAEIMTHVAEEPLGLQLVHQAERFHLQVDTRPVTITRYLRQDDELLLADEPLRVLETPGHSPGSLSFHAPQSRFVLT